MAHIITVLCIVVPIFLAAISANSQVEHLENWLEELNTTVNGSVGGQDEYLGIFPVQLEAQESTTGKEFEQAADILLNRSIGESLLLVVENMKNLSVQVEVIRNDVLNLKNSYNGVPPQGNEIIGSVREKIDGMNQPSPSSVEGILIGTYNEVLTISLPSLRQNKLTGQAFARARSVAFDWTSRKIYWQEGIANIKRGNVDGTELEKLIIVLNDGFAVDSISGNLYYSDILRANIQVCSGQDRTCSIIATNQTVIHRMVIALHTNKGLMFWVNETSTYIANMDGTDAREFISERPRSITVDEDADRVYWVDEGGKYIASSDLNGNNRKILLNGTFIHAIAIARDDVYFSEFKTVNSVSKKGGDPVTITKISGIIWSMALYGTKAPLTLNPCNSSPCDYLCVPKLKSFACLCPKGHPLDQDGTTCL